MEKGFHFNKHRSFVSMALVGPAVITVVLACLHVCLKPRLEPGIVRSNLW